MKTGRGFCSSGFRIEARAIFVLDKRISGAHSGCGFGFSQARHEQITQVMDTYSSCCPAKAPRRGWTLKPSSRTAFDASRWANVGPA
jgi:hypothetical protein